MQNLTLELIFPNKEIEEQYADHLDFIEIFHKERETKLDKLLPVKDLPDDLKVELWWKCPVVRHKCYVAGLKDKYISAVPSYNFTFTPKINLVLELGTKTFELEAIVKHIKELDDPPQKLVQYMIELSKDSYSEEDESGFTINYKGVAPELKRS